MPPQLALLLCSSFVLFLLRMDHKQAPNLSHGLWIPTIWMLSIASKPMGYWLESGGDPEAGSPLDRIFQSGILSVGLFVLLCRRVEWPRVARENKWLMLLVGYMLISVLWSEIPFVSFKRWVREMPAIIMALLVLTERSPRDAMESVFRRSVYILIPFSVLLIKYFPQYGVQFHRWSGERMWLGVTMHKNGLGRLCLISAFFLCWVLFRQWQQRSVPVSKYQTSAEGFLLLIALWLLKGPPGAYAATAIAAFSAGLATFLGLIWMRKRGLFLGPKPVVAILALLVAFGVATPMVGGSTVVGFTSALGRDTTLTGRTDVWAGLLPIIERHPVLGHGIGGFWTPRTREAQNISEAHNGYLEVMLELGCGGLLLFAAFLLSFGRKASMELKHNFDWASLCLCYLIMALVHNVSESSINAFSNQMTATVIFLAVSFSKNRRTVVRTLALGHRILHGHRIQKVPAQ